MIRVTSNNALSALAKSRSTGDLRAVCKASAMSEATAMLTATATIVTASSTIADSKDAVALIGAVASMIGAASSLVASVSAVDPQASHEIVEIVERRGDFEPGVRIDHKPALEARERRRLDVQVVADVDERVSVGQCVWDAPGPGGVYVNGLHEIEYLRQNCVDVMDLTVVGTGSFRMRGV